MRLAKPNCTAVLLRGVPNPLLDAMRALAKSRGLTMKAFILETCRREVEAYADKKI